MALPQYKQSYDQIAQHLGKTSSPELVRALVELLHIDSHSLVVDIGGGAGGDAELLAATTGARVVVVDKSREMLRIAPRSIPCICGDALTLPLRSAAFDAAYVVNVLQLVQHRNELLSEVRRTLRPGGRLALPVTSRAQLKSRFINQFFPTLPMIEMERYPSVLRVVNQLDSIGFSGIRTHQVDLGSFRVNEAYIKRLRSGIFSGLGFLSEKEREDGFEKLKEWIKGHGSAEQPAAVRRVRTIITAEACN